MKVVEDFPPPSLRGKTLQKPGITLRTWRLGGSIENLNLPQHLDRETRGFLLAGKFLGERQLGGFIHAFEFMEDGIGNLFLKHWG